MMTKDISTAEIVDIGINCLIENLGSVEAELFISTILREKNDYTKWRQRYFTDIDSDSFLKDAVEYGKTHQLENPDQK